MHRMQLDDGQINVGQTQLEVISLGRRALRPRGVTMTVDGIREVTVNVSSRVITWVNVEVWVNVTIVACSL